MIVILIMQDILYMIETKYFKSGLCVSTVYSNMLVFLPQTMKKQHKDLQEELHCHQYPLLQ